MLLMGFYKLIYNNNKISIELENVLYSEKTLDSRLLRDSRRRERRWKGSVNQLITAWEKH